MPVDIQLKEAPIYQRDQYAKGGIGRTYWDYRDECALSCLGAVGPRVADVGCGEGITLEKLNRMFPEKYCVGIDGLKENLAICRNHRLNVVGGDVYGLPLGDGTFDGLVFLEVIEHLTHPDEAMAELYRVLRPGGRVVMIFPNDLVFKIARILTLMLKEAFYDPGHVRQWTPASARALAKRHGFRVLKQRSLPFWIWRFSLHHLMVCEKL